MKTKVSYLILKSVTQPFKQFTSFTHLKTAEVKTRGQLTGESRFLFLRAIFLFE